MAEINTTPGFYTQRDLKAMDQETLQEVRDMALENFNADLGGPDAEYFELLAGAADELWVSRELS